MDLAKAKTGRGNDAFPDKVIDITRKGNNNTIPVTNSHHVHHAFIMFFISSRNILQYTTVRHLHPTRGGKYIEKWRFDSGITTNKHPLAPKTLENNGICYLTNHREPPTLTGSLVLSLEHQNEEEEEEEEEEQTTAA
ncbi:hypothetical protein A2U01_0032938, partial [Trifolium medium]|nr:hypothetical protein [Trifolium medium]